jgi:hypothetical protein
VRSGQPRSFDLRQELGVSWEEAPARLEQYLAEASSRVTCWKWAPAGASWEHPVPLWDERDGRRPIARSWTERPANLSADQAVRYGLDESDSVVVSIREDGGRMDECSAWVESLKGPVQLYFQPRAGLLRLARVAVPEIEDGLLSGFWLHGQSRATHETYTRDRTGAITQIRVEALGEDDQSVSLYEVQRDEMGDVVAIRFRSDDEIERVVFRRVDPLQVQAARRSVEELLVSNALQWMARVAGSNQVTALALIYSQTDVALPPSLALTTRADWAELDDFEVFEASPADFEGDAELLEACRVLTQEWRSKEEELEPRRTLMKVAKKLSARALAGPRNVHDGFLVVPVDIEESDLARNLNAALRDQR